MLCMYVVHTLLVVILTIVDLTSGVNPCWYRHIDYFCCSNVNEFHKGWVFWLKQEWWWLKIISSRVAGFKYSPFKRRCCATPTPGPCMTYDTVAIFTYWINWWPRLKIPMLPQHRVMNEFKKVGYWRSPYTGVFCESSRTVVDVGWKMAWWRGNSLIR